MGWSGTSEGPIATQFIGYPQTIKYVLYIGYLLSQLIFFEFITTQLYIGWSFKGYTPMTPGDKSRMPSTSFRDSGDDQELSQSDQQLLQDAVKQRRSAGWLCFKSPLSFHGWYWLILVDQDFQLDDHKKSPNLYIISIISLRIGIVFYPLFHKMIIPQLIIRAWSSTPVTQRFGRDISTWGYPHSWMVFVISHRWKWMMTRATPIKKETPTCCMTWQRSWLCGRRKT